LPLSLAHALALGKIKSMSKRKSKKQAVIGITTGDAAGIGPEVIRAALESGKLDAGFSCRVIGDLPEGAAGEPTPETARAALRALEESVRLALAGEIAAVVTGPVHKFRMQAIGFAFPG